jgi:hypothetical protein
MERGPLGCLLRSCSFEGAPRSVTEPQPFRAREVGDSMSRSEPPEALDARAGQLSRLALSNHQEFQ